MKSRRNVTYHSKIK